MALTEGDKAECREMARVIITEVLDMHIESCPHGKTLLKNRMLLIGACLGSSIGGGSAVLALVKLITSFGGT